ncbi:MAG: hypothetical protein JJT94_05015 [Bernardetiaceae bacterium]|nr:hypothetical protein [Bernardetiaceae bacterium]
MQKLDPNWLTQGLIDFEYKKYTLLAYLQHAKNELDNAKLYPVFADLIAHYQNLQQLKNQKNGLADKFPKKISNADWEKLTLSYEKILKDDEIMQELEDILEFSIPRMDQALKTGKTLYEEVESKLAFEPIGLIPIYFREGYLVLSAYHIQNNFYLYRYQMTIFERAEERFRALHLQYLDTLHKQLGQTYENLKIQLARQNPDLPNPAMFRIEAKQNFPYQASVLPVAKRLLVRQLMKLEVA